MKACLVCLTWWGELEVWEYSSHILLPDFAPLFRVEPVPKPNRDKHLFLYSPEENGREILGDL